MKSQESNGFLANGAGACKYGERKPWIIPLRGLGSYCPIAAISITHQYDPWAFIIYVHAPNETKHIGAGDCVQPDLCQ